MTTKNIHRLFTCIEQMQYMSPAVSHSWKLTEQPLFLTVCTHTQHAALLNRSKIEVLANISDLHSMYTP